MRGAVLPLLRPVLLQMGEVLSPLPVMQAHLLPIMKGVGVESLSLVGERDSKPPPFGH